MEGALNKVMAYSRLTNKTMTIELAKIALKDQLVGKEKPEITLAYIRQTVAEHFKVSIEDINSSKRTQDLVLPRHISMYLCRKLMDVSLPNISKFFNKRDHSTVINACDKISDRMEQDDKLRLVIEGIEIQIKGE
jgi:chromosomal replication initiator protein